MLNRRGTVVLFLALLLFFAFHISAKADNETFGGYDAPRSFSSARQIMGTLRTYASRFADGIGPRPRAWCGWWMQHATGITSAATGLNLNRAFDWRRVGTPGDGSPGNILVGGNGRSHVSKIVERLGGNCYLTISGNSGSPYPQVNQLRECGGQPRRI